jgi:peptidoglycan/LPS O-acetylase OafA/YrhL
MYAFLVYFASISDGFKFVFALLCFGFLLGGLIYGMPQYDKSPTNKKLLISLVLTGILCGFICAAIPTEKDVYKIAATIGQEKAIISPLGEVK